MKLFGTAINYGFGDVEETGILIAVDEILEEKRVATTTDVRWIHRHLAKEILHLWVKHSQGTQAIPEIIQGKDALGVGAP